MPKFSRKQDFEKLSRCQLQFLAKQHCIRANLKSSEICRKLADKLIPKAIHASIPDPAYKLSKGEALSSSKRLRICGTEVTFVTIKSTKSSKSKIISNISSVVQKYKNNRKIFIGINFLYFLYFFCILQFILFKKNFIIFTFIKLYKYNHYY